MTIAVLFRRGKETRISSLVLDATVREGHLRSGTSTSHPVEQGSDISDNFRPDAISLNIDGLITNHPIQPPPEFVADEFGTKRIAMIDVPFKWKVNSLDFKIGSSGPGITVGGPGLLGFAGNVLLQSTGLNEKTAYARGFEEPFDRVEAGFLQIEDIIQRGVIVEIVTRLKTYQNMVLQGFSVSREADTGDALAFNIEARQIRIVDVAPTEEVAPEPTVERAKPTENNGNEEASESDEATKDKAEQQSLSHRALGFISDALGGG